MVLPKTHNLFFGAFLFRLALVPGVAASLSVKDVNVVLERYRSAPAIQAGVTKTVEQEMLGEKKVSKGEFYFSKGKMRLEIVEPESSTLVYDGKIIWVESRFDENTIEVSKIQSRELKKTDSLLAALFDKKNILKTFKSLDMKENNGIKTFAFEPKDKKKTEVQHLELAIEDKNLLRVTYKDNIENTVTLEFKNFKEGSISKNKFSYKPPKGANISVF